MCTCRALDLGFCVGVHRRPSIGPFLMPNRAILRAPLARFSFREITDFKVQRCQGSAFVCPSVFYNFSRSSLGTSRLHILRPFQSPLQSRGSAEDLLRKRGRLHRVVYGVTRTRKYPVHTRLGRSLLYASLNFSLLNRRITGLYGVD